MASAVVSCGGAEGKDVSVSATPPAPCHFIKSVFFTSFLHYVLFENYLTDTYVPHRDYTSKAAAS